MAYDFYASRYGSATPTAEQVSEEERRKKYMQGQPLQNQQAYTSIPQSNTGSTIQLSPLAKFGQPTYLQGQQQQAQQPVNVSSNAIINAAYQKAQPGFSSQTANLTTQKTNELLQNPTAGINIEAQNQQLLDKLKRDQVQGAEALRQSTGLFGNTGLNMQDLMANQQKNNIAYSDAATNLENTRQQNLYNMKLAALDEGRKTSAQQQGFYNADVANLSDLAKTELGYQGISSQEKQSELDRQLQLNLKYIDKDTQMAVTSLKGQIDMNQLVKAQDFESVMKNLDIQAQKAIAAGNNQAAYQIAQMQGEIEKQKQASQQQWATAERLATQTWQSGQMVGQQEFEKAMQYIKYQQQDALASKDIEAQKYLKELEIKATAQMQMQGFDHDKQMAMLNGNIQKELQAGNLQNSITLMNLQAEKEMNKLMSEMSFQEAMAKMQNTLDLQKQSIQNNFTADQQQAMNQFNMSMTQMQMKQQAEQFNKNYEIQLAQQKLAEKGFNAQQAQQIFENTLKANPNDEAGAYLALQNYVKQFDPEYAKTIKPPDPLQWQKNADADMLSAKYQYAQTHQDAALYDQNGKFVGLKSAAEADFYKKYNETMWDSQGDATTAQINSIKSGSTPVTSINDPNSPVYKKLLSESYNFDYKQLAPEIVTAEINGVPPIGNFLNFKGTLFQRVTAPDGSYKFLNPLNGRSVELQKENENIHSIAQKMLDAGVPKWY